MEQKMKYKTPTIYAFFVYYIVFWFWTNEFADRHRQSHEFHLLTICRLQPKIHRNRTILQPMGQSLLRALLHSILSH